FVRRLARRAVNEEIISFGVRAVQLAEEVPTLVLDRRHARARLKLLAGPIDGPQSDWVEAVRIEQRRLIMVAEDGNLALLNDFVEALARIRPVADNVAEAVDFANALA